MNKNSTRFHLCSFQNSIIACLSTTMAIQLYILIEALQEPSKELFAMKEKLRTQLFYLKKDRELDDALSTFGLGSGESRTVNGSGTSEAGVSPIGDGEVVELSGGLGR